MRYLPLIAFLSLAACGGDDDDGDADGVTDDGADDAADDAADDGGDGSDDGSADGPLYVLGSIVFSDEGTTSYVSLLDSLDPQTIDYDQAREFGSSADVAVHDGAVFVADAESLTITKYTVEGRELVEEAAIGFGSYGLTDFGFWVNTFLTEDKAYLLNGATEYIVWNPSAMEITGTVPLPEIEVPEGFRSFPGYADRAALVRDGKLYHSIYVTDETYFEYTPSSWIAVYDVATDALEDVIEAPCPGLDYGSADPDGNLYFSSWVYAPGGAVVLDQPSTCIFEIPADGSEPAVAFTFADLAEGREGAAFRYLPDGRGFFSVFHDERFTVDEQTDIAEVTFGPNWRFWTLDPETGETAMLESVDWSSGAQYSYDIDGRTFMLVVDGDYSASTIYELADSGEPTPIIDTLGWSMRLFKLR